MNEQTIRFRLGIFVLASFLILGVLVTLFGGAPGLFRKATTYTVAFPNAGGLAVGSPVRKSGVRIGEVRSVTLDDATGAVNVVIAVDKGYSLRKSDRPTLFQALLGGDASIAFVPPDDPKKFDATPVETDEILVGELPVDPGKLLQKTENLMPPALEALIEIKKVFQRIDRDGLDTVKGALDRVDKLAPALDAAIQDFRVAAKETTTTVKDIGATAREFGEVGKAVREAVPELRKTNDEVQKLASNVNKSWPTIDRAVQEIEVATRTFGRIGERADVFLRMHEDRLARTIENVEETTKRAAALLGEDNQRIVRDILKDVRSGTARLDGLARNADELVQETRLVVRQTNKSLKNLDEAMASFNKVAGPIAEKAPAILKNVDEASASLVQAIADARQILNAVARGEGTFQKFLTDPAIYNNLNDSALMVTRILPRIDRALRDFETFADRIARHPESLGIGGVVRPSSGILPR